MITTAANARKIRLIVEMSLGNGMEDITFQFEGLLQDSSQKSLRQSKIPDLFAAK